ncbi:TetR family transcriptional regulator [Achromobacter sp. F4_2707]|uniref:TetR/AcrR family transcriptional regulator n=1 Tax=Achromobacter sp. F4_2707 TaxID=3114286 RepID=UPI0039C642D6
MKSRDLIEQVAQEGEAARVAQLSRADWLAVALELFKTEGIEAVRVTRMAEALGVTRGSFYWHFKHREDLQNALIVFWQKKNVQSVLQALDENHALDDGILSLFSAWLNPDRFEPGLDLAMRDWARRSPKANDAVNEADTLCMDAIAAFYERHGFEPVEARARARTIYACQIGYYVVTGLHEPMAIRLRYLESIYAIMTGQALAPEKAERFRAAHIPA